MTLRTLTYCFIAVAIALSLALAIPRGLLWLESDPFPYAFYNEVEATTGSGNGTDVLLITVDTLRADHLGLYGYARRTSPNIDEWFAHAQIYERAYSAEANTTPSVVSMLTGLLPQNHGVRLLFQKISPRILTVSDHMARAGYQTAAIVSNFVLTAEACGLETRFGFYDDFVDEQEAHRVAYERRAARTTDAALAWLTERRDPNRPHFLWVHYIDPHGPYEPCVDRLTDFTHPEPQIIDVEKIPDYQREPGLVDGQEYVDRYDEEIAYTDREVARLLRAYDRLGLAEKATIVFTADHGESMMEHERWFAHGYDVYEYIIRVPLMIRGPGFPPGRVNIPVSLVDLTPTLLRVAGIPVPQQLDGHALPPSEEPREIFVEATTGQSQWRGMIRGNSKWLVAQRQTTSFVGRALHRFFLIQPFVDVVQFERAYFDLRNDPEELNPLPWPQEDSALSLVRLSGEDPDPAGLPTRLTPGMWLKAPKVAPGADTKSREKLKALGYVQ